MPAPHFREAPTKLLTPEETAKLLKINPQTLNVWRHTKRYPLPFVKIGRRVRYRYDDLLRFIQENYSATLEEER